MLAKIAVRVVSDFLLTEPSRMGDKIQEMKTMKSRSVLKNKWGQIQKNPYIVLPYNAFDTGSCSQLKHFRGHQKEGMVGSDEALTANKQLLSHIGFPTFCHKYQLHSI